MTNWKAGSADFAMNIIERNSAWLETMTVTDWTGERTLGSEHSELDNWQQRPLQTQILGPPILPCPPPGWQYSYDMKLSVRALKYIWELSNTGIYSPSDSQKNVLKRGNYSKGMFCPGHVLARTGPGSFNYHFGNILKKIATTISEKGSWSR